MPGLPLPHQKEALSDSSLQLPPCQLLGKQGIDKGCQHLLEVVAAPHPSRLREQNYRLDSRQESASNLGALIISFDLDHELLFSSPTGGRMSFQWFLKIKYYIYTNTLPLPINALNLDPVGSRGRRQGLHLLHFKMLQSQTYTFEETQTHTHTHTHTHTQHPLSSPSIFVSCQSKADPFTSGYE